MNALVLRIFKMFIVVLNTTDVCITENEENVFFPLLRLSQNKYQI